MESFGKDAKACAVREIMTWCEDKGTVIFLPHLLKLLDVEYLRTWGGLKHVKLPELPITNRHWRYRFYHGVATVLGWTERVTHGNSRYFGESLHEAIKKLWSDEEKTDDKSKEKVTVKRPSPVQPSFSCTVAEFTLPGENSEMITCRVETSTHFSVRSRPAGEKAAHKRCRLPSWIEKAEQLKSEKEQPEKESSGTSSDSSGSENESSQ